MFNLQPASRHTSAQVLCELYRCYKINLACALSKSVDIALVLDSTTDNDREILGVYFAGKGDENNIWSYSYGVVEIRGHTAELQVAIVKESLKEINEIQVSEYKKKE